MNMRAAWMWCLLALGGLGSAHAELLSHPLPVALDDRVVPSAVHLRFDLERYDVPLAAFVSRPGKDPIETAFGALMAGLQAGDVAAVTPLLARAHLGDHPVDQVMGTWRKAFRDFAGVTVLGRARLGDRVVFVWEGQTERGPWVRGFVLEPIDGRWRAHLVHSNLPIEVLVVQALEHGRRQPSQFRPVAAPQGNHAFTLVPGLSLELQGRPVDFDAMRESAPTAPAVGALQAGALDAFSRAMLRLGDLELDAFASALTPKSRERFTHWRQSQGDEVISWARYQGLGRRVLFAADAGPEISLVFFAEGPNDGETIRLVRWQWLVKEGTQWRLTSFNRHHHLDAVLEKAGPPREEGSFIAAIKRAVRK